MTARRLMTVDDAPVLAELVRSNREFLAPWEPLRREDYFTEAGKRRHRAYARTASSRHCAAVDDYAAGSVVGRITLNGIVRGAFQSCSVGYWLSSAASGRGLATIALRETIGIPFGELGLHRIQARTLVHNVASQRVLERNGFGRIGMAPAYLKIAGSWQDCLLYQVINRGGQ